MIQFEESIFGAEGETVEVIVTIEGYNTEESEVIFVILDKETEKPIADIGEKCQKRIEKKCLNKAKNFKPDNADFY
jgi:hypothetical protein